MTPNANTTVKSFANLLAQQQQLQGYYVTLLRFTMADVTVSTCSGDSNSPKLLITPRKVTEVQSDLPDTADLAKRCCNCIAKAKETHVEALLIYVVILTHRSLCCLVQVSRGNWMCQTPPPKPQLLTSVRYR